VLLGHDLMRLQGFPKAIAGKRSAFSDGNLQNLAGEAFSLPGAGAIIWAFYLNEHGPWWPQSAHV
jgi:hypothetical protein